LILFLPDLSAQDGAMRLTERECLAYGEKNIELCGRPPAGNPSGNSAEENCREIYRKMVTAQHIISRHPDAVKQCVSLYLDKKEDIIKREFIPRACEVVAGTSSPPAACAKMSQLAKEPYGPQVIKECLFWQGLRHGGKKYCSTYPQKENFCLGFAAYKKAHEAGDAKLCAGSDVCRLLMGEGPKVCKK